MQTSEEVKVEFLTKLKALLKEYGATIQLGTTTFGYSECGEDVRAAVEIPSIWDKDSNQVREMTSIDLGSYFTAD